MADILRHRNDLTVLRISLDRRGTVEERRNTRDPRPAIVFEIQAGTDTPVIVGRIPMSAIGLDDRVRGNERLTQFRLPDELVSGPAADLVGDQGALWLEMPTPSGHLRLVPWEALLTEAFDRPVLRLPYFSLLPQASRGSLEVAFCASSPRAKTGFSAAGMLLHFVDAVGRAVNQRWKVHIFADIEQYDFLVQAWQGRPDIVVHDPYTAGQFELPERTPGIGVGANVRNPWLLWMLSELGDRALDAVHFICHGYFAADRGAIALASSPLVNTDAAYSRFVGAGELGSFLTTAGAWAVGLTGPYSNYAPLGLREVADSLAQTRPLHVLAHEEDDDPQLGELEAAYGLMFATDPRPPPRLRASALWVHPNLVAEARPSAPDQLAGAQWLDEQGGTTLLGPATKQALHGESTPAWIAASARVIEQVQGDLLSPLGTTRSQVTETASREDVATALRVAGNLLERHVIADSTPETGAGQQAQGTP